MNNYTKINKNNDYCEMINGEQINAQNENSDSGGSFC